MIIKRKDYQSKNCTPPNQCVLLITAILSAEFQDSESEKSSTFSIQASTQILKLKEGTPVVDFVEEKMVKYYSMQVS